MWYFDNLGAYKGAAHGDQDAVSRGHADMERDLAAIGEEAERLRSLAEHEQQEKRERPDASKLWMSGDYTEFNREQN
jgi:hydroxylamine dehydrogenase